MEWQRSVGPPNLRVSFGKRDLQNLGAFADKTYKFRELTNRCDSIKDLVSRTQMTSRCCATGTPECTRLPFVAASAHTPAHAPAHSPAYAHASAPAHPPERMHIETFQSPRI